MDQHVLYDLSDSDLAKLASEGNRSAMEVIYRRHYVLLLNFGMKYYADRDFIKDCIQELFVKLLCNPHALKNVTFVRSWLLSALKNAIFDHMKNIKQHVQLEELPLSDLSEETFLTWILTDATSDGRNTRKALLKAFKQLSGRQRMAVYLYYVKGVSHQEISAYMNINVQSSRNLLSKALSKLRTIINNSLNRDIQ